jgi:hypothetical protein
MSSPSLGRLLISHITLRGPEIAQFYSVVSRGPGIAYDDLMERVVLRVSAVDGFGLEEAPAREALNFLLVARLITQQGIVRKRSVFHASPLLADVPFALLLLHHLTMHDDERQQAMSLVHRQLVLDDILSVESADLRSHIERSTLRDLFAWTSEKLSLWASLYTFLGIVRRLERTSDVFLVPQPELLLDALRWANGLLHTSGSLGAYLEAIDAHLFACLTRRGRLHQGAAQTLLALQRTGKIDLSHEADAAQSVLVGDRRISHIRLSSTEGV